MLITEAGQKANPKAVERSQLLYIRCIYYIAKFDGFSIKALIHSGTKANVIQLRFVWKLSFRIYKTNVSTPKIDDSRVENYIMFITLFQIDDQDRKSCFIENAFLLTDISMNVTF